MTEKVKGNFPLRLPFIGEVEEWATKHNMSTNAAVGFMCRTFLDNEAGKLGRLERENQELRERIINVAMGRFEGVVR